MIQDAQIARDDFVLKRCPGRNIDPVAMIGNDYHGALEGDSFAKGYIARDRHMISF